MDENIIFLSSLEPFVSSCICSKFAWWSWPSKVDIVLFRPQRVFLVFVLHSNLTLHHPYTIIAISSTFVQASIRIAIAFTSPESVYNTATSDIHPIFDIPYDCPGHLGTECRCTSSFIAPFTTSPVCVPLTNNAVLASSISFG